MKSNWGQSAAKASWFAPLLTVMLQSVATLIPLHESQRQLLGLAGGALILFGLAAGIFALVSIYSYGWRGILIPAILGLLINGAFLALLVFAVLRLTEARAKGRAAAPAVEIHAAIGVARAG